jgi:proteasome lid subunit RPN8/RPN11
VTDEPYELFIEIRRDGMSVGFAPASLGACFEDALFRGILEGTIQNDETTPAFEVWPQWASPAPPSVASLILSYGGARLGCYDRTIFAPQARSLIRELLEAKRIESRDLVVWDLVAKKREPAAPPPFSGRVRRTPLPIQETPLPDVRPRAFVVEIAETLLEDIRSQVVDSGPVECAGLLVGTLLRDPRRKAGVLEVFDKVDVAAGPGGASGVHFSFGTESFLAARRATESRNDGSVTTGWHHSHAACVACSKHSTCRAQMVFFSSDDVDVHASAFPSAYMVGLVAGKVRELPATEAGFELYGWSHGQVQQLEYRVTRHRRESALTRHEDSERRLS